MTVKNMLNKVALIEYAERYSELIKFFNHKIVMFSHENSIICFQYRGTYYKCYAKYYPQYKQFCSVVEKANRTTHGFYEKCRCDTNAEERTYPKLAGYIATILTDRANGISPVLSNCKQLSFC